MLLSPTMPRLHTASIVAWILLCLFSVASRAEGPTAKAGTVATVPPLDSGPALDPTEIEASGAIIGEITIKNRNVFDLSNPQEDNSLFRLANRLHIVTKPHVIQAHLLFEKGDTYSKRLGDESERILRHRAYLGEVEINPVHFENGVVDVEVDTIDVWTLSPDISLGRGGGENHFGIGILEENLLGRGIQVGGRYVSSVDRDTLTFLYTDNNFLNDRYRLAAKLADNSDGFFRRLEFGKPFYALDRRRAGNMSFARGEQTDQLYSLGNVITEFNHRFDYHEVSLGRSRGLHDDWTKRYSFGIAYAQHEFRAVPGSLFPLAIVPGDREYLYPFIGFELVEDNFETTANFDQINRTEDRFLGTWLNVRLGYSSKNAGSSNSAWHYRAAFSNAIGTSRTTSLTVGAGLNGRWQNGSAQNATLSGIVRFHRRLTEHQLFYASVTGVLGKDLDIDRPLFLGGETGLRGYPLRYQNGESKILLTLEDRIFTDWYPMRLVHVGAAVFFDAGHVWGDSAVNTPNLGLLKDIGFGLRLGNARSPNGSILHIDFAFPLDGDKDISNFQILVDYKESF